MVQMRTIDDDSGGTSPPCGSGGGPASVNPGWLDVNWTFPPEFQNLLLGFDVVAYTGTDPTDASKYFFQIVRVNPDVRRLVKSIKPTSTMSNVNASVRAVYA